ncbi:MAG: helix-turn-helix domain-containing protein [Bacilli bacterium]|nr:helix-turn-helix domain-containing protein [Bacilli bacterium]
MKTDDMSILVQLGKRIRYLRNERHLSQMDLALDSDITKNYLSDLERGERNPSVMVLNKIAKGLNVTLEELFKGVEDLESLL